jgi:central kinetochore subunit Mal2/MCM21
MMDSSSNPSALITTQQTNMHRLSFTVTTFPFTDPSPGPQNARLNGRLLGIRFDHCSRNGTFQNPYYILLRRVEEGGEEWRVHRHTIPAFVQLDRLDDEFLPLKEEHGSDGGVDGGSDEDEITARPECRKQDLHGLVRKVRHELVCWELRREAIELLKEQLELIPPVNDEDDDEEVDEDSETRGLYGIQSIEATALEARQARITWTDGTIARIKISNKGLIERAVVVGESGRIKGVENLLVDGESRIENLVHKLKILVGQAA